MTQVEFGGQVAIVSGAGRGLGLSHAQMLASRGARVVVNLRRSLDWSNRSYSVNRSHCLSMMSIGWTSPARKYSSLW